MFFKLSIICLTFNYPNCLRPPICGTFIMSLSSLFNIIHMRGHDYLSMPNNIARHAIDLDIKDVKYIKMEVNLKLITWKLVSFPSCVDVIPYLNSN